MGKKKMKLLPSLFKNREKQGNQWQWRQSCTQPKTQSFRTGNEMFKTINSVFFDSINGIESSESWITNSSESPSFSTETEDFCYGEVETVVRGLKSSKRLFFELEDTSSILQKVNWTHRRDVKWTAASESLSLTRTSRKINGFPFKESVVMAMDSDDPYVDFRRSMEEMVETHGLKDWEYLGELLGWYLKVNGRNNHGLIVGAFVDMLVGVGLAGGGGSCSDSTSYSSVGSSFLPFPPPAHLRGNEVDEEGKIVML